MIIIILAIFLVESYIVKIDIDAARYGWAAFMALQALLQLFVYHAVCNKIR